MQLHALDHSTKIVHARHAQKKVDYHCPECDSPLRLRAGQERQSHFFHIQPKRSCRLSGKSARHLAIQETIEQVLPEGESTLEHRFPTIGRIADVFWAPQNIIFEVQCSPISSEEVEKRNQDYASLGLSVVWILHDNVYNQWKRSSAERFLKNHPHYFTNIQSDKEGIIYDQFTQREGEIRCCRFEKLPVDLTQIQKVPQNVEPLPHVLAERLEKWPLYFAGDLLDVALASPSPFHKNYIARMCEQEKKQQSEPKMKFQAVLTPLKLLYQTILKSFCK